MRVFLSLLVGVVGTVVTATSGNAIDILQEGAALEERGAYASAILNEAVASLHLMYAAAERKDIVQFYERRENARKLLARAVNQLRSIEKNASDRAIVEYSQNADEEFVRSQLNEALAFFKIAHPKTQREMFAATTTLVEILQVRLEENDIDPTVLDRSRLHELIRIQLDTTSRAGLATSLAFRLATIDTRHK